MNILMPLPHQDFDPTEVGTTWRILSEAGHHVHFATPDGLVAIADPLMISGEGLDAWGFVPGLKKIKLLGLLLRAQGPARQAYAQMQVDSHFIQPMTYEQAMARDLAAPFDALVLPGGHAKGMRPYLESTVLQNLVSRFFAPQPPRGTASSRGSCLSWGATGSPVAPSRYRTLGVVGPQDHGSDLEARKICLGFDAAVGTFLGPDLLPHLHRSGWRSAWVLGCRSRGQKSIGQ